MYSIPYKQYFLTDAISNLEAIEKEVPEVSPIINELAKIKRDLVVSNDQLKLFSLDGVKLNKCQ